MKMVTCGCKWCRGSMRFAPVKAKTQYLKRAARHKAKQDLKQGKEPEKVYRVPYMY